MRFMTGFFTGRKKVESGWGVIGLGDGLWKFDADVIDGTVILLRWLDDPDYGIVVPVGQMDG